MTVATDRRKPVRVRNGHVLMARVKTDTVINPNLIVIRRHGGMSGPVPTGLNGHQHLAMKNPVTRLPNPVIMNLISVFRTNNAKIAGVGR